MAVGVSFAAENEFRRRAAIPLGISADITQRDVQDRLTVSDEQRRQIAEFEQQRQQEEKELTTTPSGARTLGWTERQKMGESFVKRVESVLSAEQTNQWFRLRRLDTVAIFGPYRRIDQEEARDELTLRDDQLKAVADLQREYCRECERLATNYEDLEAPAGKGFFQGPFFAETRKVRDDFDTRFDSLMDRILDKTQSERWSQLEWQKATDQRGIDVLLDDSIVAYLQLTDAQKAEIKKRAAETDAEMDALFKAKKYVDQRRARAASVQKGIKLLHADQRQRWQSLLGRPFRTPSMEAIYGEPPQP